MKKSIFAALTLACVLLAGCNKDGNTVQPSNGGAVYTQSTSDESTEQSTDSESTNNESTEQSSDDESSSEQPPDSDPVVEKRPGYKSYELTFPVNDGGKTEYNAHIYEVEPFKVIIDLPEEWEISESDRNGYRIRRGDEQLGGISYNIFPSGKYDPSASDYPCEINDDTESNYVGIYNQLMLSSMLNWNGHYKRVNKIGDTIASTCRIMEKDVPEDEWSYGILARNKPVGVYIQMPVNDPTIPYDTIEYIAKTIEIK